MVLNFKNKLKPLFCFTLKNSSRWCHLHYLSYGHCSHVFTWLEHCAPFSLDYRMCGAGKSLAQAGHWMRTQHSATIDLTPCHWLWTEVGTFAGISPIPLPVRRNILPHAECTGADEGERGWRSLSDSWPDSTAFLRSGFATCRRSAQPGCWFVCTVKPQALWAPPKTPGRWSHIWMSVQAC